MLRDRFNRRIHPVQTIMFFAGLLAFVLGVIARFVVNERILKAVVILLVTVSVLALLCIGGIVLTYLFQMMTVAIHRYFGGREEYRFSRKPPADIRHLCKPSGRNLEFASRDDNEVAKKVPE